MRKKAADMFLLSHARTHLNDSTHPNSFHHEADISDAQKVCDLVNRVDRLHVTGDLKKRNDDVINYYLIDILK